MKNFKKSFAFLFATMAIFFMSYLVSSHVALAANKVNINTADAVELDTIPEVGPSTAAKIVAYREANGFFSIIEDIMKVSGIKQATFDKMKDFITVESGSGGGGSGDSGTTTATTTDKTATTTATSTTSNTNPIIIYSVHYIQEDLSDYDEPTDFEISAGRDRLGYIDSPINFVAKHKVSADLKNVNCNYVWNFGDGVSQAGEKIEHIYKYAGDYNVVLNGTCNVLKAVSRTTVKVLVPNLSILQKNDEAVEITNNGSNEINLYNWKILSANSSYVFPMDTIISAGQTVTFPGEYLKIPLGINGVILVDALGKKISQSNQNFLAVNSVDNLNKTVSVSDVEKFIAEYKKSNPVDKKVATVVTVPDIQTVASSTNSNIPMFASVADVIVESTSSNQTSNSGGFWSKLFHPIQTIKDSFYR